MRARFTIRWTTVVALIAGLHPVALAQGAGSSPISAIRDLGGGEGTGLPPVEVTPSPGALRPIAGDLRQFFEREPLGFSGRTFVSVGRDISDAGRAVAGQIGSWWQRPLWERGLTLLALLGLGFLLWLAWWVDRWLIRLGTRWSEGVSLPGPAPLTRAIAGLARIGAVVVIPLVLLAVDLLVLRGVFEGAKWTVLASDVILLWMASRAAVRLVRELLQPGALDIEESHVVRVRRTLIGTIWLIIGFQVLRGILVAFDYRAEVVALVAFVRRLSVTALIFYLIALKDSVLSFLPETGPRGYETVRRLLAKYYVHLMVLTGVLGLMWTFGYRHAAGEIMWRGYLTLGLLVVASLAFRVVYHWLERPEGTKREEVRLVRAVLESASGYLKFFGLLVVAVIFLEVVGALDLVVTLAKYPLVSFGQADISVYLIFRAVVVLLIFLLVSRVVRPLLHRRLFVRLRVEEGVAFAVGTMVHYALFALGVVAALLSTGLNLSALGWFAGALGVGIGFGLQEIVRDVVSGFVLLFGRAVTKGDVVTAGEEYGEVKTVGARSVTIRTPDNIELMVPTSSVVNGTIVNWTKTNALVRLRVPVGVSYGADPSAVKEALLDAASEYEPVVKQPPPKVWLTGFGDSSVDYDLLVWYNAKRFTRNQILGEIYFAIWTKLHEAGIEIPFPQRDLHLKSVERDLLPLIGRDEEPENGDSEELG